jgi:hypothetical protein
MSSLFVMPFAQAFLANGTVAGGATLTFYLSGTTTLATVYDDDGDALPNPVPADAFGIFPPIYLGDGGALRLIMRDMEGNILHQIDPLPSSFAGPLSLGPTDNGLSDFANVVGNAQLQVSSPNGYYAIVGYSRSSDNPNAGSQNAAIIGLSNNDNTGSIQTGYAGYFEARRQVGTGTTQAYEAAVVNFGDTPETFPYNVSQPVGLTEAAGLTVGRGDLAGCTDVSHFLRLADNGSRALGGIVIGANALRNAKAIKLDQYHEIAWYFPNGATQSASLRGFGGYFNVFETTSNFDLSITRGRPNGTDAAVNDLVGTFSYKARTGGADMLRAYTAVYVKDTKRTSFEINALNQAGNMVSVSLHGVGDMTFAANATGVALGTIANPWASLAANQIAIGGALKTLSVDNNGFVKAA